MSGPFILLAFAIFTALLGLMFTWRFLLWVFMKATASSLAQMFTYAAMGAALLAFAVWLFFVAQPGLGVVA